jgi:16S rRNA (guanine966-N2)-methyltransferase
VRVISGSCKGRPLKAVPGQSTRPTTDKVKESIFNMIGPYFDGGTVLDLFAGSGGLGIEALSRGVEKGIFVDRNPKAIETLKANITACHFDDIVEIYRNDADRAIKAVIKREMKFSMILLDPPYHLKKLEKLIETIDEEDLLLSGGTLVAEHSTDDDLPDEIGKLKKVRHEKYGKTIAVTIYTL